MKTRPFPVVVLGAILGLSVCLSAPAFADGDVKKGQKVFKKKCRSCHRVKEGKNAAGPHLFGIVGRASGSVEGYRGYSKAMRSANIVWDEENLAAYLKKPKKFLPGSKMQFAGLKKDKDIVNILAFLKTLK